MNQQIQNIFGGRRTVPRVSVKEKVSSDFLFMLLWNEDARTFSENRRKGELSIGLDAVEPFIIAEPGPETFEPDHSANQVEENAENNALGQEGKPAGVFHARMVRGQRSSGPWSMV